MYTYCSDGFHFVEPEKTRKLDLSKNSWIIVHAIETLMQERAATNTLCRQSLRCILVVYQSDTLMASNDYRCLVIDELP